MENLSDGFYQIVYQTHNAAAGTCCSDNVGYNM